MAQLFEPSPNPAPNPAGFANAAVSAFNDYQTRKEAQQTAAYKAQQQGLKDAFETELKMREKGYTLVPKDSSGLVRRGSLDPNQIVMDPQGRAWTPTQTAAKPDATPQQTYSDTSSLLEKGATPLNYTPADPAAEHAVSPPGGGGQYYRLRTPDESLASKLDTEAAHQAPTVDTEHFNVPVSINHAKGTVTPLQLPEGVTHNEKPDKPGKYTYNHFTDDNGKLTITRIGPDDATPEMWDGKKWAPVPAAAAIGPKRRDPDEPTPDQKAKDAERRQAIADKFSQKHETLQQQEQEQWALKQQFYDAAHPVDDDGKPVVASDKSPVFVEDPRTKGRTIRFTPQVQKQFQILQDQAEKKAVELQGQAKGIRQRFGWGEFGPGAGASAERGSQAASAGPTAAAPNTAQKQAGQQAPAKSKGQLTDKAVVASYVQKAGGNTDKARQLAKADGWVW